MARWNEQQLRDAVTAADSLSDVLRHFELRAAGGNFKQLRVWLDRWQISTDHFTHGAGRSHLSPNRGAPIGMLLVEGSTCRRTHLKKRLYKEGLKARKCEMCGVGEEWNGGRISLILDHVNGVHDDNRIENLRIVCPNCNATLPTHCGKNRPRANPPRPCPECGEMFPPEGKRQRFCSRACWQRERRRPRPNTYRVAHPPHGQLLAEITATSWSAVGRKYGVSDNAIRKWVRVEERARAGAQGREPRADSTSPDGSHAPPREEAA